MENWLALNGYSLWMKNAWSDWPGISAFFGIIFLHYHYSCQKCSKFSTLVWVRNGIFSSKNYHRYFIITCLECFRHSLHENLPFRREGNGVQPLKDFRVIFEIFLIFFSHTVLWFLSHRSCFFLILKSEGLQPFVAGKRIMIMNKYKSWQFQRYDRSRVNNGCANKTNDNASLNYKGFGAPPNVSTCPKNKEFV